jgi:CubicO group peptidase (beta-lactamase class C family)
VVCAAQESKLSSGKLAQIDAAVSKFMSTTHVPGLSVAVVENGGYKWAQGFGVADLENNVPSTEHTLFRLASISKSLTATAAMQLWERGQLDRTRNIALRFLKNRGPFPLARFSGTWAGFAITNPVRRMTPKSATRNTLTIPSRQG